MSVRDERSVPAQDEFVALLRKHAPEAAVAWQQFPELDVLIAGAEERRENISAAWEWVLQGGLKRPSLIAPEAAALFDDVEVAYETYAIEETADEWLDFFRTSVLYRQIHPASRVPLEEDARRMIERRGGIARSPVADVLVTALRAPNRRV